MAAVGTVPMTLHHAMDTRYNMYELPADLDPKVRANAFAAACLMTADAIRDDGRGGYALTPQGRANLSDRISRTPIRRNARETFNAPLAEGEKFRTEPAPGFGSAFLVAQDEVLTAGHCVCARAAPYELEPKAALDNIRVVFRFHKPDAVTDKTVFDQNDVYRVKEVLFHGYSEQYTVEEQSIPNKSIQPPDWARIKLDRPVVGIQPVILDSGMEHYRLGRHVYSLGCPTGVAVKCTSLGVATIGSIDHDQFTTDIDNFGGNSGSMIVDSETHQVVGICIRGVPDYVKDQAHFRETGQLRVINYRVLGQHTSVAQKITMKQVDFHKYVATFDRNLMFEWAGKHSKVFEEKHLAASEAVIQKTRKCEGTALAVMKWSFTLPVGAFALIGLPAGLIALGLFAIDREYEKDRDQEKARIQKICDVASKYGAYFNEAHAIIRLGLSGNTQTEIEKVRGQARSVCLWNWSHVEGSESDSLAHYELDAVKWQFRFSPFKIGSLMLFERSRGLALDDETREKVLLHLQKHVRYPKAINIDLSAAELVEAVRKAWVAVIKETVQGFDMYRGYPELHIQRMAEQYVLENGRRGGEMEAIRADLGLPAP